jgi:hypothetical protein
MCPGGMFNMDQMRSHVLRAGTRYLDEMLFRPPFLGLHIRHPQSPSDYGAGGFSPSNVLLKVFRSESAFPKGKPMIAGISRRLRG